jgi:hypothetical protein
VNLFHIHRWIVRYNLPGGYMVRICTKKGCRAMQSHMFDFFRCGWYWIDGNFVTDSMRPVYVIAGNHEEFLEAKQILEGIEPPHIGYFNVKFVRGWEDFDRTEPMPTVIFYGTWYTNGILEDPRLTEILNHRR